MPKRVGVITLLSLVIGALFAPIVTSAVDRREAAQIQAAQVRQDIAEGRYTQQEYDCDFDDCDNNEIYTASKQAAAAKHANQFLAQIKEFYHGTSN